MIVDLKTITSLLAKQDYLEYEKILEKMIIEVRNDKMISIKGTSNILKTEKDVDFFNRRMIQVHGIYGLV